MPPKRKQPMESANEIPQTTTTTTIPALKKDKVNNDEDDGENILNYNLKHLLDRNLKDLLIKKVISNEGKRLISVRDSVKQLFLYFKKDKSKEIESFFKSFLNNYSNEFTSYEEIAKVAINTKCYIVLDILMTDYNLKITNKQIYQSIKSSSLKMTQFMYNNYLKKKTTEIETIIDSDKVWNLLTKTPLGYSLLSFLNFLPNYKLINFFLLNQTISTTQPPEISGKTYNLLQTLNVEPFFKEYKLGEFIQSAITIKYLENQLKQVQPIQQQQQIANQNQNNNEHTESNNHTESSVSNDIEVQNTNISIKEIEQIIKQFSKSQLSSNLKELYSIGEIQKNDHFKRVYQFILSSLNIYHNSIFYHLLFGKEDISPILRTIPDPKFFATSNFYTSRDCDELFLLDALKCGSFDFIKVRVNKKHSKSDCILYLREDCQEFEDLISRLYMLERLGSSFCYPDTLFAYCKNDKEKQTKFIKDSLTEFYNNNDINKISRFLSPSLLFSLLIQFDNVDLVIEFIDLSKSLELDYLNPIKKYYHSDNPIRFIKSIKMLDFLYNNLKNEIFFNNSPSTSIKIWFNIGKVELIEHFYKLSNGVDLSAYEYLIPKFESIDILNQIPASLIWPNLKSICFIIKNQHLYGIKMRQDIMDGINMLDVKEYNTESIEYLKFIIENSSPSITYYPFKMVPISPYDYSTPLDKQKKLKSDFLEWILTNRTNDIKNGRCKFDAYEYSTSLFLTRRLKELFTSSIYLDQYINIKDVSQLPNSIEKDTIILLIAKTRDLEALKYLIELYKTLPVKSIKESFFQLLKSTISFSLLSEFDKDSTIFFNFIHSNYPFILKSTKGGWLTNTQLKSLFALACSFQCHSLPLVDFFVEKLQITLTNKQFVKGFERAPWYLQESKIYKKYNNHFR